MARVKLTLTCTCCGKSFEHVHTCRKSSEEASYAAWARENVTICPACYGAQKNAERTADLDAYLSEVNPLLPEISGVSDKQVSYAASLRRRFVVDRLYPHKVNVAKFQRRAAQVSLRNISDADLSKLQAQAERAGVPFGTWFADARIDHLKNAFDLYRNEDVLKLELIYSERNASKIIDALR